MISVPGQVLEFGAGPVPKEDGNLEAAVYKNTGRQTLGR